MAVQPPARVSALQDNEKFVRRPWPALQHDSSPGRLPQSSCRWSHFQGCSSPARAAGGGRRRYSYTMSTGLARPVARSPWWRAVVVWTVVALLFAANSSVGRTYSQVIAELIRR